MAHNQAQLEGPPNPAAMTVEEAARLLSAAGGQAVTVAAIEADVAAGAPVNADGTLNLVYYCAWLVQQAVRPVGATHAP